MERLKRVRDLLFEHMDTGYPAEAHLDGADFEHYDSYSAATVYSFVRDKQLSDEGRSMLQSCKADIEKNMHLLQTDEARDYFERLLRLINAVTE